MVAEYTKPYLRNYIKYLNDFFVNSNYLNNRLVFMREDVNACVRHFRFVS